MRDNGDFVKDLRNEIYMGQERRTKYVLYKLSFIVGIFGVGSIKIGSVPLSPLLYLTTLVVLVFDLYILGEDFGVKRAGRFLIGSPAAPAEERRWERTVQVNRDPVTGIARFISSIIVLLFATLALWKTQHSSIFYYMWIFLSFSTIILISIYSHFLVGRLRKLDDYLKKKEETLSNKNTQQTDEPDG
jgi:hypothetical protein